MSELLNSHDTAPKLNGTAFVHGDRCLQATYKTSDFSSAVRLLDQVAVAADAMNHHPDAGVGYGTIGFTLSSHDAGGVTDRDVELALRIHHLADAAGATSDRAVHPG